MGHEFMCVKNWLCFSIICSKKYANAIEFIYKSLDNMKKFTMIIDFACMGKYYS